MTFTDHPLTAEQVKLLIREGEGLTVEFKEHYTPRIDEDIVAFANARGGTLLLGVRDDGSVTGERLTNDLKAKINSLSAELQAGYHHRAFPDWRGRGSQRGGRCGKALLMQLRLLSAA